jgi:tetratricopeptide (TPR) repeat protein
MLYFIIPPIIIIMGTATLVILLWKKISADQGVYSAFREKTKTSETGKFGPGFLKKNLEILLKILEVTVSRFKLLSLKFHNCCQRWFQSLKKRREEREKKNFFKEKVSMKLPGEQNQRKIEPGQSAPVAKENIKTDEIKVLPLFHNRVILSRDTRNSETKNRLEEALIERIAANPQDIEAYERLGDYYMEQANYQDALECFKYILSLNPVHEKARMRVKRLEIMLGK